MHQNNQTLNMSMSNLSTLLSPIYNLTIKFCRGMNVKTSFAIGINPQYQKVLYATNL